jgi:hypothetical protein
MALDVKSPIKLEDIKYIELIKGGKIIILHGNNKEKLVLKEEESASVKQVNSAKAVIKAVDPSLKTKIVSKEEAKAVIAAIEGAIEDNQLSASLNNDDNHPLFSVDDLLAIKLMMEKWLVDMDNEKNPVLKMAYVDVKDVRSALEQRLGSGPDRKASLREFAAALNAPGGFEKLGAVIAADMMNDNHDRFSVRNGLGQQIGERRFQFKALTNPGNVFLEVTESGGRTLSGLDYIPPGKVTADFDLPLKENHPAKVLADKTQRAAFVAKVVSDLETLVHPKRGFLARNKLKSDAAKRMIAGMIEGARKIETVLQKKASKQANVSAGLTERLALLAQVKA